MKQREQSTAVPDLIMKPQVEAPAKRWVTLEEWKALPTRVREKLLLVEGDEKFNEQMTENIGWARWSYNPITGCKYDCPYCYARDIANRLYPQKFEPALIPSRLAAPRKTRVPDRAKEDISYKNVFTGSMADIFGQWVPAEWIMPSWPRSGRTRSGTFCA